MDRLVAFYTEGYAESERLMRDRLEFDRTRELLRARLPAPPARVLDVGGGTGVHAAWLRDDACSHLPAELRAAGLERIEVLGIEGPAWFAHPDPRVARLYDAHPELSGASAHLLGVGHIK